VTTVSTRRTEWIAVMVSRDGSRLTWGPFPTRRVARRWVRRQGNSAMWVEEHWIEPGGDQ